VIVGLLPVLLALLLDLVLGDPPNRYHPVAWMGAGIGVARRLAPRGGRCLPLLYGAAVVIGGTAVVGIIGIVVEKILQLRAIQGAILALNSPPEPFTVPKNAVGRRGYRLG